jgi:uncharacterized membrane protein YiaA
MIQKHRRRNTPAFTGMAYFTLAVGMFMFIIGMYNASHLELAEKGYYIATMLLVAIGAILTQKVTRDNAEDNAIIEDQERELGIKLKETERGLKDSSKTL